MLANPGQVISYGSVYSRDKAIKSRQMRLARPNGATGLGGWKSHTWKSWSSQRVKTSNWEGGVSREEEKEEGKGDRGIKKTRLQKATAALREVKDMGDNRIKNGRRIR